MIILVSLFQVNSTDNLGQTPLHHAARDNLIEACKLLLSYGADTGAMCRQGLTPSQLASENIQKILQG